MDIFKKMELDAIIIVFLVFILIIIMYDKLPIIILYNLKFI